MKTIFFKFDPEDDDDDWDDYPESQEEPLEDMGCFDREWDEG